METRYQYQPWYVKLWRRRWYLWCYSRAVCATISWVLHGCPRDRWSDGYADTRWVTFKFLWIIAQSDAAMKMQWYYTLKEVMGELHEAQNED